MSYTKGPWVINYDDICASDDPTDVIAICRGDANRYSKDYSEVLDNAKLIAAAPELLELLEIAACPQCDGSGAFYDNHGEVCQCQWCDERKKAIAKARGLDK